MNGDIVKVIAFYLPQFHAIPENDAAHGIGFTEWSNTRKAKPLFEGHYQPRTPLGQNYYCLLDNGVMEKQVELAKQHGIYGFCYYHYWFKNGKKLLEKPIEMMRKNPKLDIPYCLSWANENWTKKWDGGNNETIIEQDYGNQEDLIAHVEYLCDFFSDPRYIKEDGCPIFLLYKPELVPNLTKMIRTIREHVVANGFPGIKIFVQYPKFFFNGAKLDLFDGYIQFQPRFIQDFEKDASRSSAKKAIKKMLLSMNFRHTVDQIERMLSGRGTAGQNGPTIRDYQDDWNRILAYQPRDRRIIAGAFTDWDNTPRNKNGLIYKGATPELFQKNMHELVQKVHHEYSRPYIFLNAWNEWAEGAYLEPDEKYRYAYLEALQHALECG